jgi:hypothetical protein
MKTTASDQISLSFRVPRDLHEELRREAIEQNMSLSEAVLWHLIERKPISATRRRKAERSAEAR